MFTKLGVAVAITSVLAAVGGWSAGSPELVAIGLTGVAALLQAALWMLARPDLLAVREIQPVRVSEGDPARALLLVQNLSRTRSPSILATDRVGGAAVTVPVPSLPAGAGHTTSYPLPTGRRGVFQVGPFSIGHSDPLRLMSLSRTYSSTTTLTVHPLVHPVEPIPTGLTRDTEGPTSANAPRGGIAFHSIRPYERGDSIRDIHWKKSAQTGQLLVLQKVVPDEPSLMVVLDTSAAPYSEPAFEDAVRVAASLCLSAITGGHPLELRTTGGDVVVSEGNRDAGPEMLDLLASVTRTDDDPGLVALAHMSSTRAAVSLGVVTGQPASELLAILPLVRPRYLMLSAVQMLREPARVPDLPGVFLMACKDSDDFARRWNGLLAR
jgi:uncharacterized protein (DUF58 family)